MGSVVEKLKAHSRRQQLKNYAHSQLSAVGSNRCNSLANIVDRAAGLVSQEPYDDRADLMMEDLERVLIGEDMQEGRGKGQHFVGHFRGSSGFKSNLRDQWNQVQHATAGIVLGYFYLRPVQWFVSWLENEPQDKALYDATYPLGRGLHSSNIHLLGWRLRSAIGDQTCKKKKKKRR